MATVHHEDADVIGLDARLLKQLVKGVEHHLLSLLPRLPHVGLAFPHGWVVDMALHCRRNGHPWAQNVGLLSLVMDFGS